MTFLGGYCWVFRWLILKQKRDFEIDSFADNQFAKELKLLSFKSIKTCKYKILAVLSHSLGKERTS